MELVIPGKKNEQWFISEELRKLAISLILKHDELGHIDPNKVVFGSLTGADASQKWWGKCTRLMPQVKLLPLYVASKICETFGDDAVDDNLLDIKYIITINIDSIAKAGGDMEKITEVTMYHELLHIDPFMEKIVEHDIKDFKQVLDKFGVHWDQGLFKNDIGTEDSD